MSKKSQPKSESLIADRLGPAAKLAEEITVIMRGYLVALNRLVVERPDTTILGLLMLKIVYQNAEAVERILREEIAREGE